MNVMLERVQALVTERTASLAALSHDLRTPIGCIQLRSELLDDSSIRIATKGLKVCVPVPLYRQPST